MGAHPGAFCALEWDSTNISILGFFITPAQAFLRALRGKALNREVHKGNAKIAKGMSVRFAVITWMRGHLTEKSQPNDAFSEVR